MLRWGISFQALRERLRVLPSVAKDGTKEQAQWAAIWHGKFLFVCCEVHILVRVGRCIFWLEAIPEASPGSVLGNYSRQCSEDHTVLLGLPSAPFLSSVPLRLSLTSQTYLYMIGFSILR